MKTCVHSGLAKVVLKSRSIKNARVKYLRTIRSTRDRLEHVLRSSICYRNSIPMSWKVFNKILRISRISTAVLRNSYLMAGIWLSSKECQDVKKMQIKTLKTNAESTVILWRTWDLCRWICWSNKTMICLRGVVYLKPVATMLRLKSNGTAVRWTILTSLF